MVWVLACEQHYTDGTVKKFYHKGVVDGIFYDIAWKPSQAKQYSSKKEALADHKISGLTPAWIPERIA